MLRRLGTTQSVTKLGDGYVFAPLKIVAATGSPGNPIALI
jgi:hypothetical protein